MLAAALLNFLTFLWLTCLSLERVQKEAEESWLEGDKLNEEFSEELTKIAAAVNNSFSHWKELQVDENRKCAGHVEQILPKAENIFGRPDTQRLLTGQWRFSLHFRG